MNFFVQFQVRTLCPRNILLKNGVYPTHPDTIMSPIKNKKPLGFPWSTQDPFLFCVHHVDYYPPGNPQLGPATSLAGRPIGQDFDPRQKWRMYHGEQVPGFPAHPHSGFETVTIVTRGLVDHSDSLGAAGRFGLGDVQWMTAGKGVQHCEMFPLLDARQENPLELFQIWLNLPRARKKAEPYFAMLWNNRIPVITSADTQGKSTSVKIVAGRYLGHRAPAPAPDSWAADDRHDVAIWVISMQPGATWTLPKATPQANRTLFFYEGSGVKIAGQPFTSHQAVELWPDQDVEIVNMDSTASFLLLQGVPIGEPVVQHGPFVGNSAEDIQHMMYEFQRSDFGGWPWPSYEHVHEASRGRFARYPDGREEHPTP